MGRSEHERKDKPGKSGPPRPQKPEITNPEALTPGLVKRMVTDKGFGFIREIGGTEYFFHQSACRGVEFMDLREGDAVRFLKSSGPKGPRAEIVQRDPDEGAGIGNGHEI